MPISLQNLVDTLEPERTVLFFGAGSSIPSGAPSASELISRISSAFGIAQNGYQLSEIASLAEMKNSRHELIKLLREIFIKLKPTGGLLNIPIYNWKSIYTTNYDNLIEQSYRRKNNDISVCASDYDFSNASPPNSTKLFKIHGTIEKDIVDGNNARIVITDSDYDHLSDYRKMMYARLRGDLMDAKLIIIGHSLGDRHIKDLVEKVIEIKSQSEINGDVILFLFQQDDDRAALIERRGIKICFGGIDDFFAILAQKTAGSAPSKLSGDAPIDRHPRLSAVTTDVTHSSESRQADVKAMFAGWPASHADILAGHTFPRTAAEEIVAFLKKEDSLAAIVLGASGVGKSTACRQALQQIRSEGVYCWEHKSDFSLPSHDWVSVAKALREKSQFGVLMIDDAHTHLFELNSLADQLNSAEIFNLKIIVISTRHQWNPRMKSPALYKAGREFLIARLNQTEIESLLNLIDANRAVRDLVEQNFSGFSRQQRRRRLMDRCESDMFVCLKNIFASESFDDIILREYADLDQNLRDVYRYVAAMENAGIRVHRQLLVRILGIPLRTISALLDNLTDIIHETELSRREGIYAWDTRHAAIAAIVTKYKFSDEDQMVNLFENVIENINPTYEIEIRTIRELCNAISGIPRISDKNVQNRLLRRLMSTAPAERVPRHRLVRNLIEQGAYEKAEIEIRIFEKDFGIDGPTFRYKIALLNSRASDSPGILTEDRIKILESARSLAISGLSKFKNNKGILQEYAECGILYYKFTKDSSFFDGALKALKRAEVDLGEPDISRLIARLEKRMQGIPVEGPDFEVV